MKDLNDIIDDIEDFQSLVLETNAERLEEDWWMLGYPTALCKNNPYRLAYRVSEGVRLGLTVVSFFNGLRNPQ